MREMKRVVYIALGAVCVTLGLLGIFVPVLPTTVFLLLAAFFFGRSSDRALHWLLHNRWFGPYIRNYREGRGMEVKNKVFTLAVLWTGIGATIVFAVDTLWVRLLLLAVAVGVTIHILWIKTYYPDRNSLSENGVLRENSSYNDVA